MPKIDLSALPDPELDAQFYAGVPFKRLLAWVFDVIAIILLSSAAIIVTLGIAATIFPILMFAIHLAYRIYMLKNYSATGGMILTGIELRNQNAEKLSTEESVWHTLSYTFMVFFIPIQFLSMIMMLLNKRGQGLHDYFLGTVSINRPVDH